MPTQKNNVENITSIRWTLVATTNWTNYAKLFGVVSNRAREMVNAYNGLVDAYGVAMNKSSSYYTRVWKGNPQNKTLDGYVIDEAARDFQKEWQNGWAMGIEYVVNESKLKFYKNDEADVKYSMDLPTNIAEITHWHPCICLRFANDTCKITNVVVK